MARRGLERGAIYGRLSKDRSGLSENVEIQVAECRGYAVEEEIEVGGVFADNDISASRYSRRPRPGYEALLAAIRAGRVEVVLVTEMTRLYRRMEELLDLIRLAESTALRRIETTSGLGYDLSTGEGIHNAINAVNNAMLESRQISDRIKRKKRVRAAQGLPNGGARPYGYESGGMVVREAEAAVLREVARRAIAGESFTTITLDLNERGVPTAKGTAWRVSNLQRLVLSKRYLGVRTHHGAEHPAQWPAIFSPEEHELLVAASKARQREWTNGRPGARTYLLTGLAVCGRCGSPMVGSRKQEAPDDPAQRRYRCRKVDPHGRATGCGQVFRAAEPLELFVSRAVLHRFDSPEVALALAPREQEDKIRRLVERYDRQRQKLDELVDDYAADLLSKAQFARAKAIAETALEQTREELGQLQQRQTVAQLGPGQTVTAAWETADLHWRRSVLNLVVQRVEVLPGHPGMHQWRGYRFDPKHIKIRWKR